MNNTLNFRDCGACPTTNGNKVKTGLLFRSASLDRLSRKNRAMVQSKNLSTIIDLRPANERPSRTAPLPGIRRITIPLDIDRIARKRILPYVFKRNGAVAVGNAINSVYFDIVALVPHAVRELFAPLSDTETYPLCINCRAGKDRTGYAIALILRTLGVADSVIITDYLRTNDFILPRLRRFTRPLQFATFGLLPAETMEESMTAHARYLQTAFARIDNNYGGIDEYLDFCGVPRQRRERLRGILLLR